MRIINTCDLRTKEERIYYYMFDKNKERFLINNIEIIYYYKQNNVVIMKNCKIFATQICEKLREEALNHKKNEEMTNEIRKSVMTDSKKNEIKIILRFLDTNLKVDMFTEDFIANNGLQYLDTIIQYNTGNIRTYALIAVNNLLDFQNAFNYFEKKKEFLSKLYEILMNADSIKTSEFAIYILIKIISTNEEKIMYLIDIAEKYANKTNTKIYSQIVKYLQEDNKILNLKIFSLLFINKILNYCDQSKLPTILDQLRDTGIFEILDNPRKYEEKFEEQIKIFNKKTEMYRKEIKYSKTHYYKLKSKYINY